MPTTIFLVMNENAYNELSSKEKSALDSLTGLGMSLRAADGLAGFGKLFETIEKAFSEYENYRNKTDRLIPVFIAELSQ